MSALDSGRGQQDFFLDQGSVSKVGVVLALDSGQNEFPVAVALGGISQRAVISAPRHPILGLGSAGDTLGGIVFNRGYKHLTTNHKGHHLAVGRDSSVGSATGKRQALNLIAVVVPQADAHLAGLSTLAHGVEFTVLGEAQGAIVGNREEAHGIDREVGLCLEPARTVQRHRVHVHRAAVALTQEVDGLAIGAEHGIAVLTADVGQVGMLLGLGIIAPDVACDRRRVVLAVLVLATLAVLIDEVVAALVPADVLCRCAQLAGNAAAIHGHLIDLGQAATGEQHAAGGVLYRRAEVDVLAIGAERPGRLGSAVARELLGLAAIGRHHIHVVISLAVAGKSQHRTVGRPHGHRFITGL